MDIAISVGNNSAMLANVLLPEEVANVLTGVQTRWKDYEAYHPLTTTVPLAHLDADRGHGPDNPGLIFLQLLGKEYGLDSPWYLKVRTSFGIAAEKRDKDQFDLWDSSTFDRLHLSVAGERKFYTQEYVQRCLAREYINIDQCEERVHFSMRWLNGKFDDWHKEGREFNSVRTSYIGYQIPGDGGHGNSRLEAENLFRKTGTKKFLLEGVVPMGIPHELNGFLTRDALKFSGAPNMGYESVLGFLSRFGDVSTTDAIKIPGMKSQDAVDYLLTKVLPAIEKFVQS